MSLGDFGNLASIVGLVVAIGTLWLAHGAKEAARETLQQTRLRSLNEVAEATRSKIKEMGTLILVERWEVVGRSTVEVAGDCTLMVSRWGDQMSEGSRARLLKVPLLMRTVSNSVGGTPSLKERQAAHRAALRASEIIGEVLGECLKTSEEAANAYR